MAARAVAGLVDEIITTFGPQVLQPLFLRPASSSTLRLQVGQHRFFKSLEARKVKIRRHETVLIGANDSNCLSTSQILLSDHDVFGIAAVVVQATFGRAARPGAVETVELWKSGLSGLIRTSG